MSNVSTQLFQTNIDGFNVPVLNILLSNKQIISIPSQIGCNNECSFCISKNQRLIRNLKTDELLSLIDSVPITSSNVELSFTGEGEPLHNLKNINQVINRVKFSSIKIAFSGMGSHLISQINTKTPTVLQFSLHQANQIKRNKLIPKSDRLDTIRNNLIKYQDKFEKININYVVVPGENNSHEDILLLEKFVEGTNWNILFNPLLTESQMIEPKFQDSNLHQVKFYKKVAQSITDNHIYPNLTYQIQ